MRSLLIWMALLGTVMLSPAAHAQKKMALLVRVSEYNRASGDIPRIGESANQRDVSLMREVLAERGFTCDSLEDNQATHDNIMAALNQFARQVGPKDAVVFYFSGHGANSKEAFSLCPYDATKQSDVNDIHESDLQQWLTRLNTRNVTLILDCCFTKYRLTPRGFSIRPKFIGRDDTPVEGESGLHHIDSNRAVVLAAASDTGEAYQVQNPRDKSWVGLFTYNLHKNLKQSKTMPEVGYTQLMENVGKGVQTFVSNQNKSLDKALQMQKPMLYGSNELAERKLFSPVGGSLPKPPDPKEPDVVPLPVPRPTIRPEDMAKYVRPYLLVERAEANKVTLSQGSSSGVVNNAEYALYPPNSTQFVGKPLSRVKVVVARENDAEAVATDGSELSKLPAHCRATLTRLPGGDKALEPLVVKLTGPNELVTQLQTCLKKYPFVQTITGGGTRAQCRIDIQQVAGSNDAVVAKLLFAEGNDAISNPCTGSNMTELAEKLAVPINRAEVLLHFVHLENPNPKFKVQVSTNKSVYNEGDEPVFTVMADEDCYVFVIGLDESGFPNLLYPLKRDEANLLAARTPLRIPDAAGKFEVGGVLGREVLVALTISDRSKAEKMKRDLFGVLGAKTSDLLARSIVIKTTEEMQTSDLEGWNIQTQDYQTQQKP